MKTFARAIVTTLIAAAFLGQAGFADAASKKKRKPAAPPSSYAPGPSNQRVYGAPIQGPIVTTAATRTNRARADFQRLKPCPSTGKSTGTCPGYTVGYKKSLASGGPNNASNMVWKPTQVANTSKPKPSQ